MTTDQRLREAYARAVEARDVSSRAACVSPEALLALARREGRERDRLATLDHAMSCAACRRELELLRAIERAGDEGVQQAVERIRWRRYVSIAIAASAVLAVLAVSLGPGRQLWDRDGGDVARSPGSDVVLLAPATAVSMSAGAPLVFTWRPVPGARDYTLEVLTSEGMVALSRQTPDTSLTVAPPASLAPGEYHWTVRARGDGGAEHRSDARRLRVVE